MAFAERLAYVRGEGFRTAKTTLPFRYLGDIEAQNSAMAEKEGFEPSIRY